jgi:ABC-type multidrug transport system ATPase subunit
MSSDNNSIGYPPDEDGGNENGGTLDSPQTEGGRDGGLPVQDLSGGMVLPNQQAPLRRSNSIGSLASELESEYSASDYYEEDSMSQLFFPGGGTFLGHEPQDGMNNSSNSRSAALSSSLINGSNRASMLYPISEGGVHDGDDPHNQSHLSSLLGRQMARKRYINKLVRVRNKQTGSIRMASKGDMERNSKLVPMGDESVDFPAIPKPLPVYDKRISSLESAKSEILSRNEKDQLKRTQEGLLLLKVGTRDFNPLLYQFPINVRLSNFSFSVPHREASSKIRTVYNSSFVYSVVKFFKRLRAGTRHEKQEVRYKYVLDNISLSLKPGKMYLVLGPPGSGRSSLLKAIAGRLSEKSRNRIVGTVTYNGKTLADETDIHIENAISMIDQLDRHAPRYTVGETFEFSFQCKRRNGQHIDFRFNEDTPENRDLARAADESHLLVNAIMKGLGIDHVKDTFVGNDEIRGVSGGQRRRVTVGEMMMDSAPILCGDEISNGLDAASTYDIIEILMEIGKIRKKLQVISLLQPAPETVACFDEVIVMGEGKVLFAGPIYQVEDYFASLGYRAPIHMDIADFLQHVATPDGAKLFNPPREIAEIRSTPYSVDELAKEFRKSIFGRQIEAEIADAHQQVWGSAHGDVLKFDDAHHLDDRRFKRKYANSFLRLTWLNLRRQITLWRRDKRVLIANAAKNMIMGISVGGVFFQTEDPVSVLGAVFQAMLFVMLGGMITAPACEYRTRETV